MHERQQNEKKEEEKKSFAFHIHNFDVAGFFCGLKMLQMYQFPQVFPLNIFVQNFIVVCLAVVRV